MSHNAPLTIRLMQKFSEYFPVDSIGAKVTRLGFVGVLRGLLRDGSGTGKAKTGYLPVLPIRFQQGVGKSGVIGRIRSELLFQRDARTGAVCFAVKPDGVPAEMPWPV